MSGFLFIMWMGINYMNSNTMLFIDESGNTGEPSYSFKGWNWHDSKYFGLGALQIISSKVECFRSDLKIILKGYKTELGDTIELKSTANYVFNKKLMRDITVLLNEYKADIFLEITNKRFHIMQYLIDYCINPYYLYKTKFLNSDMYRAECLFLINFIYAYPETQLIDQLLSRFVTLCHNDRIDDSYKQLPILINDFYQYLPEELSSTKEAILERIENYELYGLTKENLFPPVDRSSTGNKMCFAPNVDSINSILSRICKNSSKTRYTIVHDEQNQFERPIDNWISILNSDYVKNIENTSFISSKNDVLIQLVDFVLGKILRIYDELLNNKKRKNSDDEWLKIVKPLILNKVNVVAPYTEQKLFFNYFGAFTMPTEIPFQI